MERFKKHRELEFKDKDGSTLADRMNMIRRHQNLSQVELGKKLGISGRGWQGYETGKNVSGGGVLRKLVLLGYNANWILTGKGQMKLSD